MDQTSPLTTNSARAASSAEAISPISEVTNDEQFLIEAMREHGYGHVEDVPVRQGRICVTSKTQFFELARRGRERARRSGEHRQFAHLHHQHSRLLSACRQMVDGRFERIEFADGLPVHWTPV